MAATQLESRLAAVEEQLGFIRSDLQRLRSFEQNLAMVVDKLSILDRVKQFLQRLESPSPPEGVSEEESAGATEGFGGAGGLSQGVAVVEQGIPDLAQEIGEGARRREVFQPRAEVSQLETLERLMSSLKPVLLAQKLVNSGNGPRGPYLDRQPCISLHSPDPLKMVRLISVTSPSTALQFPFHPRSHPASLPPTHRPESKPPPPVRTMSDFELATPGDGALLPLRWKLFLEYRSCASSMGPCNPWRHRHLVDKVSLWAGCIDKTPVNLGLPVLFVWVGPFYFALV